jgi:membrane protein
MRRLITFRTQVQRLVTQPQHELQGAQRKLRYLIDLTRHCARELYHDRAEQMAAALTYRTIFSLIPLFVLGLVVFRMFGGLQDVQSAVQPQVYGFFGVPEVQYAEDDVLPGEKVVIEVPDPKQAIEEQEAEQADRAAGIQPPPQDKQVEDEEHRQVRASIQKALTELTAKVANLDFASLGVVGVLLFIYAGMALAVAVEQDFNIIFGSPAGRAWHLRLAIYWSILTLGSGLLALSLYATGQIVQGVAAVGVYRPLVWILSRLLAMLASWVLLFLLYSLMPNTKVYKRPALIGSLIAAILWESGKIGFQAYVMRALPYSALYGSLGLIPVFLFWVYVSWLIVLFGLELTYTLQVMHGKVPAKSEEQRLDLPGDPEWFIPMLTQIGQAFAEGKTIGRQQLSEQLGLPSRVVNEFGKQLEKAGLIHCVVSNGDGDTGYTLARPPEKIAIATILDIGKQLSLRQHNRADGVGWSYLDHLYETMRTAAADMTLSGLIESPENRQSRQD